MPDFIQPLPHLRSLYRSSDTSENRKLFIGLDRNERVTPLPPTLFKKILRSIKPEAFCHYPDPREFYSALSRSLGLPSQYLYATPGSDGAIRMIFHAYTRPGDKVVFPDPSYAMYGVYGKIFQAQPVLLPYDRSSVVDLDKLAHALKQKPRLLFIANPDQPTGSVLSEAVIEKIISKAAKSRTLVVIDEAYYPFHPHTTIKNVLRYNNLIVTRTFSKAWGLAGVRLGLLAAPPALIKDITKVRGAFEVTSLSFAIGTHILSHPEIMRDHVAELEKGRAILVNTALELEALCPPCPTNFQLLRWNGIQNTQGIVSALRKRGFLVKGAFNHPSVSDCIRVTLAKPAVMRQFVRALRQAVKGAHRRIPS